MQFQATPDNVSGALRLARQHRKALPQPSQKSKAELRNEAKVLHVQEEIRESKQAIVQHIIRARNLEESLGKAAALDKSLKVLLRGAAEEQPWMQHIGMRALWLDKGTLMRVEAASGLPGMGHALQKTLHGYDDAELVAALDALPDKAIQAVDVKMFVKIALAVSHGRLRPAETADMYLQAVAVAAREVAKDPAARARLAPSSTREEAAAEEARLRALCARVQWDVLVRMLRKRLRLVHLVLTMPLTLNPGLLVVPGSKTKFAMAFKEQFNQGKLVSSAPATLARPGTLAVRPGSQSRPGSGSGAAPPRPASGHMEPGPDDVALPPTPGSRGMKRSGPQPRRVDAAPSKRPKAGLPSAARASRSPLRGHSLATVDEQTVRAEAQGELAHLRHQLLLSNSRVAQLGDHIAADLADITQTVRPGLGDTPAENTATHFAKHLAMRKLEVVLVAVGRRAHREAWRRWLDVVRYLRTEGTVLHFLVLAGAHRFKRACVSVLTGKLRRAMQRIRENTEWFKANELFSALVEIQRVWRGAATRCFLRAARRLWAAIEIQRVYRGHRSKPIVRAKEDIRRRHRAQMKIAKGWFRLKRTRVVKERAWQRVRRKKARDIQRVFRGVLGRQRAFQWRKIRRLDYGALKLQTLWRQYCATLVVDAARLKRRRHLGAVQFQRAVRGMIARKCAAHIRLRHASATRITYALRRYIAYRRLLKKRAERQRRIEAAAALNIQRVARGRLGRRRFQHFLDVRNSFREKEKFAFDKLRRKFYPVVLGHVVRKKWEPILQEYTMRRFRAATAIKLWMRWALESRRLRAEAKKRVAARRQEVFEREQTRRDEEERIRKDNKIRLLRMRCATRVQAFFRGYCGRKRAHARRAEKELEDLMNANRNRTKAYYRMKEDYWKAQNLFHRPYAIRIQRVFRGTQARVRVVELIRQRSASRIQHAWRGRKALAVAHEELLSRRESLVKEKERVAAQSTKCFDCQRVVRGYLARRRVIKIRQIAVVRKVLERHKRLAIADTAVANFRRRKARLVLVNKKAVVIQALVRRFLGRCWFLKRYKRMMRDRVAREKKRKEKAATKIQAMIRRRLAKKIVAKRRREVAEEKRVKEAFASLEMKLEELHSEWLEEIFVIRAQSGVRGWLAKKAFLKRSEEIVREAEKKWETKQNTAATKIQSLARGVAGRRQFNAALPALIQAAQLRLFCVECEKKVAKRRCLGCKDKYCVGCYERLHRKGGRFYHSWLPTPALTREQRRVIKLHNPSALADEHYVEGQDGDGEGDGEELKDEHAEPSPYDADPFNDPFTQSWASNGSAVASAAQQGDWDEHWDDNAQAKYWFNRVTGEAQWVNPYSLA